MRPFLQFRLGVTACAIGAGGAICPVAQYEATRRFQATIEIDRGDQRLYHIGPHIHHVLAGDLLHVGAGANEFVQRQLVGNPGAALGADELVQANRQLSLIGVEKGLEQKFGDAQPKHPIAQEFQPLIVARPGIAGAGMRQRAIEALLLGELVTDRGLELQQP